MHILIVGYSNIVRRRVLPALGRIASVKGIDIASKTSAARVIEIEPIGGEVYDAYEAAIANSRADLAYVSLVNSAHACWVEKALERGLHVVVDKPAFTDLRDAVRLSELAVRKNLCLAESTVYAYHPQIELIREVFVQAQSTPTRITATFSFPPLAPGNFRYVKALGGGALWDLGPYAITAGRLFFGQAPDQVFCRAPRDPGHDVETAFSMLAAYPGGQTMIGHFGFDTEYRNHMTVLGPSASVDIDRVFTTPAEMSNELQVRINNQSRILTAPKADPFGLFLQAVIDSIQRGDHHGFAQDLMADASALQRLRAAAAHTEKYGEGDA